MAVLAMTAAAALAGGAGCNVGGGGGGGGGGGSDGGGGGGNPDGGGGAGCAAAASLGALGALTDVTATQENQPGSQGARQIYKVDARVAAGDPGDFLHVELYDDRGAFAGGAAAPGTYQIGGAETSPDTCGVCVYLYADVGGVTGMASQVFMAQSGSFTLDALRPTTMGSVASLDFVQIDPASGAPLADGCASSVDSADYSATLQCLDNGPGCQ